MTVIGALRVGLGTWRRVVSSALVWGGMNLAIRHFTVIHPFLLADNRHYVFYLFRWFLIPYRWARYALTPIYLSCVWLWLWCLRHSTTLLWMLGFVVCTAVTLVPTPLVEPRYFLIPTIILRTQLDTIPPKTKSTKYHTQRGAEKLWLEWSWYTLINLATISLFLLRKFRWEGWEGWMRFMW